MKKRLLFRTFVFLGLLGTAVSGSFGQPPPPSPPAPAQSAPPSATAPSAEADVEAATQKQIARLIEQLGDADYFVRQRAQEELLRLGFDAFEPLAAATVHDDLEIAARAKYLLQLIRVEWTTRNDPPEVKHLLKDYEFLDAPRRRLRMRALAQLPDGQGILPLCRLARFEKSPLLAKQAAVELLGSPAAAALLTGKQTEQIRKVLVQSNRPAVRWILAWLRPSNDPQVQAQQWNQHIDAELHLLRRKQNQSTPEIVAGLARFQVAQLKKRGENKLAQNAMRRLIELMKLGRSDPKSLQELFDWLLEQKAWKIIDEFQARFAPQIAREPLLIYSYAQAKALQGQVPRAEKLAELAFRLYPGGKAAHLKRRLAVALELARRGLFPWSKREYEYILAHRDGSEPLAAEAASIYSEMLHDQGEDLKAAQMFESLSKTARMRAALRHVAQLAPEGIQARIHFFHACHWLRQGDRARHKEALEKACAADPGDIEVLIACYHLPDEMPEFKRKILVQIQHRAAELRKAVALQPNLADNYNQYAWLIANTEGDLDEALKLSKKSLELEPNTANYLDTLAHVHYARGEYETAVKIQTRAAKQRPHFRQINQKLELFKKALEEQKSKDAAEKGG